MHNRIFNREEPIIRGGRAGFADVTGIALECRFPFKTHVSRRLLKTYMVPGVAHDDEGRILVEALLSDTVAAMTGQLPSSSISFGKSFELMFTFVAQRRRGQMSEKLNMTVLFGPYDADPEVFIYATPQPSSKYAQ